MSTISNPENFRTMSILIDHLEERHPNLLLHTARQLFHGCCKAIAGDNLEASRQNRMDIFNDLLGDFFSLKAL